jgi:protein-S-isoprenylcysteine O-methyltransferase Ste14
MSWKLHLLLLALSWAAYGAAHSALASTAAKGWFLARFPNAYRGYRLGYNLLAAILLVAPLWLMASYPGQPLWRWPAAVAWLPNGIALLALAGFVWSARYYDTGEFLGTRQLRGYPSAPHDQAPMSLSPLHRWVRHPWYFLGLAILWTREMDAALLTSAVILTLYLAIGARLEDGKLVALYGEPYRRYREKVPGLVPLPWRHLSKRDADDLLKGRLSTR